MCSDETVANTFFATKKNARDNLIPLFKNLVFFVSLWQSLRQNKFGGKWDKKSFSGPGRAIKPALARKAFEVYLVNFCFTGQCGSTGSICFMVAGLGKLVYETGIMKVTVFYKRHV